MRTYLVTAPSANYQAIPNSKVWINNLQRGLESLGSEVLLPSFDTQRHMQACMGDADDIDPEAARELYSQLFVEDVRRCHQQRGLDLVVAYVWSVHLLPQAIQQVSALGIPTVLFYCNAAHQFHLVEKIAPFFDACMVPEQQALAKYRAVGAHPVHIQMAADPEMYHPYETPRQYDVTFVGQRYLNRQDLVAYLAWHGTDIRVWGPGWRELTDFVNALPPRRQMRRRIGDAKRSLQRLLRLEPKTLPPPYNRFGGILTDDAMARLPSQSHISLNISEVRDELTGEIKRHIRLRDFEIPMSGGLMMTGYQEELNLYYEVGKEIVCYDTPEELLEKCRYYLKHDSAAEAIRQAGYQRARRDHTWANRFQQLFDHMGLSVKTTGAGLRNAQES